MKIKRIVVKNLFGIFNHEIPLNTKEHITIIHGPNGYGKTILLTLLNAIFNSRYHKLRPIPFNELVIDFDDNSILSFKKEIAFDPGGKKETRDGEELALEYSKPGTKSKNYTIKPIDNDDLHIPISRITRRISDLERIGPRQWLYLPTQEILSIEEIIERYQDFFPYSILDMKVKAGPKWLKKIQNSININFIEAQRLLSLPRLGNSVKARQLLLFDEVESDTYDYREASSMIPSVKKFSKELAVAIQSKLAEYGSLSQKLDRTFPTRLVKRKHLKESTIEELNTELKELEAKRSRLIAAGFLDKEKEIDFKDLKNIDDSNINVLSVYINDVKEKLVVFNELTDRIDLLVNIIKDRFLFKQLLINKKNGFTFTTEDGKSLPLTSLSSGEQHELVLLYEMLFKVEPNSLILIDEPELSLHVVWQQQFLKDLQKITRLVGFDVLIATHSPQIINDRWDLTVELEGPK